MTDFEAYLQFLALKLHFTSDHYDYFKYNGKHNASLESYDKRTDKRFFKRLARRNINIVEYYVSNLIDGKEWVSQFDDKVWKEWLSRNQSIEYNGTAPIKSNGEPFITGKAFKGRIRRLDDR